ncbi:hypothetical protein AGDE_14771 [Angomonas deanei]|uniref:Uncharacterized protein n=1 Tax=Angomonas deanei TaxID=59799 RepID=A0A7G2C707_9TRYP|nr:hypothetical protein AGDE_14771 [Angomonas deanei]CAD2214587.1 hypothetical protein, conserved [Angomonas deanei]|eukprot:EPY20256.1 hypothetical protein AGDE_14771 [Angomonas deanei]
MMMMIRIIITSIARAILIFIIFVAVVAVGPTTAPSSSALSPALSFITVGVSSTAVAGVVLLFLVIPVFVVTFALFRSMFVTVIGVIIVAAAPPAAAAVARGVGLGDGILFFSVSSSSSFSLCFLHHSL